MTENMFKYFSKDGAKLAPSVCPVTRATQDNAEYRILFSVTPMKTVSQTTHGSETRTIAEPFNANVTYSDGSTATVEGEQNTTVVVPTETTISRSSVAVYMYAYRVKEDQLELISTDDVVFSRVAASGSGDNAAGAELGAGIGNLIRQSKDRHRADKLFEEALKAILAEAQ
jgi:DNA-directed RNA polymerase subunit H (RpoH/RPB5)